MEFNKEDTAAIGQAIYNEKIKPLLKPEDKGNMVVIDVKSGDWEMDYDDAAALFRLWKPGADMLIWSKRVGYRTPYVMNGHITRSDMASEFCAKHNLYDDD